MAKRRNKTKAKRALVGMGRTINGLQHLKRDNSQKMSTIDDEQRQAESSTNDLAVTVQGTEIEQTRPCAADNDFTRTTNEITVPKQSAKARVRKCDKIKSANAFEKENDGMSSDELLISPIEIDGDTCIDIECGTNEAVMYLSKLCVGSKGACINFSNSWFTPNEFQSLSGRETAKDWKRSIRHKGRSLKLLISKRLIKINSALPKTCLITIEHEQSPGKTEIHVDAVQELNVAAGQNEQCSQPEASSSNIPKPKRGRKLKKKKPGKTVSKERVFIEADVVDDIIDKPSTSVQILVDKIKHYDSNTHEQSKSLNGDNRTDEEKRLDEFVKSLRLTKTTVNASTVSTLKTDDDHWPVNYGIVHNTMVTNDNEPEMPALHKESDIHPSFNDDQWKLLINDNALPTTVTPPPTPPIQPADTAVKVVDDRLVKTFQSHLASPDDGLELRINTDKVVPNADVDKLAIPHAIKPKSESVLLQDTLQSAKKYKEHLQQNKNESSDKTVIQVPHMISYFRPANQFKELDHLDVRCSTLNKRKEKLFCFPFSSPIASSTVTSPIASSTVTSPIASSTVTSPIANNTANTSKVKPEVSASAEDKNFNKEIKSAHSNQQQFIRNELPSFNNFNRTVPKNIAGGNLSEMNFKDVIAIMTSAHGPLAFSADNRDAAMAFAVLQERHQNDNMFNFFNHGQPSPLLYPMIGQQILSTMTQQLYNMCNAPVCVPQHLRNLVPRMNKSNSDMYRASSQKSKAATAKRVMYCSVNQSNDLSQNKRKQIDAESDCALDLSVKKARAETRLDNVPTCDGPLDCSTRTLSMSETLTSNGYNKCYIEHFNNAHWSRSPDCNKRRSYSDHVTVNNYTNIYKPNEIHSHYETNKVTKRSSASCSCGGTGIVNDDISSWSVERVCHFLKSLDGCEQYTKTFHDQGINGRLLPYLTTQHLTRTLGMKVGSALTLMQAIDSKFREQRLSSTLSPCTDCRL